MNGAMNEFAKMKSKNFIITKISLLDPKSPSFERISCYLPALGLLKKRTCFLEFFSLKDF